MLPFTKRPGRDESGESEVVTKDDLVTSAAVPAPVSKRNVSPAPASASTSGASGSVRGKFASVNDEEMTTLMSTKALGDARPSPRPAAGAPPPSRSRPATIPPPSRSSAAISSSTSASRSGKFAAQDEEEDGRTVVRGAPKIVKRTNAPTGGPKMGMPTSPTTISPAAVIKATLESARAAGLKRTGEHLMAPPPADLLEDKSDDRHPADVGAEHTQILQSPSSSNTGSVRPPMVQGVQALSTQMLQQHQVSHGTIPPGSARPMSNAPPPMNGADAYGATQSGGYAAQSGGYAAQYNGAVPSGSVSVPGVAMPASLPAHFMVPQAPYSDGRMDPPATAVTARTKVSAGRPAMSWAMALAAFGIFVGVGAVAVMHGNADGFMETSASFVDPSRAAPKAAGPANGAAPTPVPVVGDPPPAAAPPVAAVAAPADPNTVAAPVVTTPPAAAAPAVAVAAAPAAAPAPVAPAAPVAAAPAAKPAAPAVTARPQGPARGTRPAAPPPDEAVAAAPAPVKPPKPGKPAPGGKPAGGSDIDEETKKALDALQKSQLESSF